jgi:hypothetical protein
VGDLHAHRRKIAQKSVEAAIRELARRQVGNVSRSQLLEVGLTTGGIDRRLRNGSLVVRYTGVYCQAPARQDPQALIAAAVLAGGPDAIASHGTAGFLWGFLPRWKPPPEITLSAGDRRPRGILTHRCRLLRPRDITREWGIRVTSRARTALDLAPRLTTRQLTRLVNDALRSRDLRPAALRDVLERNRYHPGTKLLIPFAENDNNPTNSEFEDDFLAFTAKYGLPTPQTNVHVNGRQVDAFFPEHNLIVECDGWEFHKQRSAFEDDRERDAAHLEHGHATVRITEERLTETPDREAARLQTILSRLSR